MPKYGKEIWVGVVLFASDLSSMFVNSILLLEPFYTYRPKGTDHAQMANEIG